MMVKQNDVIDVLVVVRTGLVDSGRQRRRSTGKHAEDVYLYTQQITGSTGKHAENIRVLFTGLRAFYVFIGLAQIKYVGPPTGWVKKVSCCTVIVTSKAR